MIGDPVLRTERLELWRPGPGDLQGLVDLIADEETRRFLGPWQPGPKPQFDRLMRHGGSWSFYGYGSFFVRLPGRTEIIGSCGMFHSWRGFGKGLDDAAEAGWIIHRDHWGLGYAGEAMAAAIAWFDATQGPRRIAAMIDADNFASQKVARRFGFDRYGEHDYEGSQVYLYERLPA